MRIAWFSPMAPDHTEIANHSERLVGDLRTRHEVTFFSECAEGFSESEGGKLYRCPLREVTTEMLLLLNAFDLPVYNLGNHPDYFAKTWFLSQAKPGIVILHDLKLHHFYAGIFQLRLRDMPRYLASMRAYYGRLGQEAGLAYWNGKISVDFMAQHFPMTEWAVRNALAIVVHTSHALEVINGLTRTPARLNHLAYTPKSPARVPYGAGELEGNGRFTRHRRARVILFGFLNVNRRIVEFLTALAAMPERDRFDVSLVGTVRNSDEVQTAIHALGLRARVKLHGYVPESELEHALDEADLAVNLRYPTMGEASGSQLRIWDHALPSLVTHTEGYATMPPETVFFVRPDHERADVQEHLRQFLERPLDFARAGQRGQQWLLEHHLPATYVAGLEELFQAADGLRSRHARLILADRAGAASARWLHATRATGRDRFYAASISELL